MGTTKPVSQPSSCRLGAVSWPFSRSKPRMLADETLSSLPVIKLWGACGRYSL